MNETWRSPGMCKWITLLVMVSLPAGCDREPPSFYPFTPGLTWQYRLKITTADRTTEQKYIVSNQAPMKWADRTVHARRTLDGTWLFYLETGQGIHRIASQRPGEAEPTPVPRGNSMVLSYPLRRGTSWFINTETLALQKETAPRQPEFRVIVPVTLKYTVESLDDSVTVPAGKYDGCLRVRGYGEAGTRDHDYLGDAGITVEKIDWYAPGVGLVKSVRRETTSSKALPGGEVLYELESFGRR